MQLYLMLAASRKADAVAGLLLLLSCRMLLDGDVMLTNRQPTLHKPSLMAHK